jgi:hypothetical protein
MSSEQRGYLSYLLRLWQIRSEGELIWRASLESVHTGERKGFANLADVFIFLEQEISHVVRGQMAPNADGEGGGDHE